VCSSSQIQHYFGSTNHALKLAINTAQVGRVFQDRSHTFKLLKRPTQINYEANIYNLNVQGKRGNIVQVYPAVEYNFVPLELEVKNYQTDLIHLQWTGSNSHQNGRPGGDGQTGDDGQGKTGTDRNNFVQIFDRKSNFPLPFESSSMWQDVTVIGYLTNNQDQLLSDSSSTSFSSAKKLALFLSSSGYFHCANGTNDIKECVEKKKERLDVDLNGAPASLSGGGVVIKFNKRNKIYHFMSSRNNAFSNRSQKGSLIIK